VTTHARTRTVLSWSGGKDSALALHALLTDPAIEVCGLLTTATSGYDRVSMHGVRMALVEEQAKAVSLPLTWVHIPPSASNADYERAMTEGLSRLTDQGIEAIAFGDLFLEDVRAYRERLASSVPIRPLFPIWGKPTAALARSFIRDGFRATLVCVDPRQLAVSHCGGSYDDALLDALPESVDPCGEHGEFHTFVYDAPMFCAPIEAQRGEVVERSGFVFCDLLPGDVSRATCGDASRGGTRRAL
jgi:uncharacterized protein (TIGR00290 family)